MKLSQEKVIKKFNLKHNNLYDYSKVEYKGTDIKVNIICKTHGEFLQTPHEHLCGCGCQKCAIISKRNKKKLTYEKICEILYLKYKDKYTLDKNEYNLNYNNIQSILQIKCNIHNKIFKIKLNNLIYNNRKDCCDIIKINNIKKKEKVIRIKKEKKIKNPLGSLEDRQISFINRSKIIHNNKYDYSNVNYIGNKIKVEINCPKHGNFKQTPNDHLGGHGCKSCTQDGRINHYNGKTSKNNKGDLTFYIVEFNSKDEKFLKVGITKYDDVLKKRYYSKKSRSIYNVKLLFNRFTTIEEAFNIERLCLDNFRESYKYNPNFNFPGKTECLDITCKDLLIEKVNCYLEEIGYSNIVSKINRYYYNLNDKNFNTFLTN